jgi:acetyl-CoA synthetase
MLDRAETYDDLVRRFRWQVPARFNIAEAACERWAHAEPDRVALVDLDADLRPREITYGALSRRSNRLAHALAAHGIGPGDRVAILLPQGPATLVAHFALYKLGAVALPLALVFGPEALAFRLTDAGARAVITTAAGAERIAALAARPPALDFVIAVDGDAPAALRLEALLEAASDAPVLVDTAADDPAMMIYTSGTTGPPKGALHAHRVLIGHLPGVQMHHEFLPQAGDRLWTPADWAWAGGLLNVVLPGLMLGVPVVSHAAIKFDPERAWRLMAEQAVRNVFLPPTALKLMRAAPPPAVRPSLRTVGSGGEALGSETYEWGRSALGVTINEFYGQTECNLVLGACAAIGVSRAGAIGKPVPGHAVAVIDEAGRPQPAGTLGQIAVARPDPVMFLGYWNKPEATAAKFVGDYLVTGDQGVMDEDGYVTFVGRDDDVITSAGYRIGPAEIEDCLVGHPAVSLAAAVGKPDPIRTEIVKAYVALKPGFAPSEALAAEIRDFVRTRLSAHEYPREVAFVADIPLTSTGKVIRRHFREAARAEVEGDLGET